MPARLILNADDFGLTRGINRAIGELASAGAITSATLMAAGPAFDDAVAVAQAHPALGVGCHIVLTDGVPVSAPESIPSLLGADGRSFRPSLRDFLLALFLGRIREEEVEREALAQIEKLQRAGIAVTHIDTHKHTHMFPSIARPLLQVASRCGVHGVRNPFEPAWALALHQGDWKRQWAVSLMGKLRPRFNQLAQIRDRIVLTPDGTVAISATGQMDQAALAQILRALPATGTFELCCHPGYNDLDLDRVVTRLRAHRDIEREALLREVPLIFGRRASASLIHYGNLDSPARNQSRDS